MARRLFIEVLHLGTSAEVLACFQDRIRVENVPEKHLIVEQNAEDENLIVVLSGILQMSQVCFFLERYDTDVIVPVGSQTVKSSS